MYPNANEFTLPWPWKPKCVRDERVVLLVAQYQEAFASELLVLATLTRALHAVVLHRDSAYHYATDDLPLHGPEQLAQPGLTTRLASACRSAEDFLARSVSQG